MQSPKFAELHDPHDRLDDFMGLFRWLKKIF